jgi:prevent-host-death family protein
VALIDGKDSKAYNLTVQMMVSGGFMIAQAINITELRQNLPSYINRVEAGESFLVTVRGKVVARIQPAIDPAEAAYQRLLSYRGKGWIGDVLTPLDEEWTGDRDNL